MSINFHTEGIKFNFSNKRKVKKWIFDVIEKENCISGDVNFVFCSDKYILDMNKKYLNHNYYTDVITFDYRENNVISGDIFISIDTVKKNSIDYNVLFYNELLRVLLHGVLHILGYDDKTEKDKVIMKEKENFYLDNK